MVDGNNLSSEIALKAKSYKNKFTYKMNGDGSNSEIDCSHFVWMVHDECNVKYKYMNTSNWNQNSPNSFEEIDIPEIGCVIMFNAHMGIVTEVNVDGTGMFVHAEGGKGAQKTTESNFCYGNNKKFYYGKDLKITKFYKKS